MKKFCLILLVLAWATTVVAIERSQSIVVINGAKYYLHTVQSGETLYALSKAYGVGEAVIVEQNPTAASGIRVDEQLRIPFLAEVPEKVSERKLRKTFDMHFVAQGETLYAISRRYAIPIPVIINDNPNLDPIHLRLGERILLRHEQRGTEPASQVEAQWEQYKDNLNIAAEPGSAYHLVHPGETLYSISRRFNTTEEKLSALNGGLKASDLKAGAIIKVPEAETTPVVENELIVPGSLVPFPPPSEPEQLEPRADFTPLSPSATLRVALMLPASIDGKANANYLEFYQGFLQGLDSIKRAGYSVRLDLYNTGRNIDKVQQIVESDDFQDVNLIIGPVYEEALAPVVRFAEHKNIPVVSPLASLTQTRSNVLFQLSPTPQTKYDKIADLIDGSRKITLIHTDHTDKEFEAEVLDMLGSSEYTKRYFHYNTSDHKGSAGDLTPILHNDADNLFIILADNEVDVDRILAAIASANTSITSRGFTPPRFVVLGNTRWNRYNNIDRAMLFKNRVVFLSTYHAKRDAAIVLRFDSEYIRAFGSLPTLYSYRGYDSAVLFGTALFGDICYDLQGESYTPLQTTYIFGQEENSNHANRNWMRVNYNSDFTITIE